MTLVALFLNLLYWSNLTGSIPSKQQALLPGLLSSHGFRLLHRHLNLMQLRNLEEILQSTVMIWWRYFEHTILSALRFNVFAQI